MRLLNTDWTLLGYSIIGKWCFFEMLFRQNKFFGFVFLVFASDDTVILLSCHNSQRTLRLGWIGKCDMQSWSRGDPSMETEGKTPHSKMSGTELLIPQRPPGLSRPLVSPFSTAAPASCSDLGLAAVCGLFSVNPTSSRPESPRALHLNPTPSWWPQEGLCEPHLSSLGQSWLLQGVPTLPRMVLSPPKRPSTWTLSPDCHTLPPASLISRLKCTSLKRPPPGPGKVTREFPPPPPRRSLPHCLV